MSEHLFGVEIAERPAGFAGPNLSPTGLDLSPRPLGEGTYALVANIPPKDNNGVIVGEHASLVIDAGITPEVGHRIRTIAEQLGGNPVAYLAHTTYHGDHTFGSSAFGAGVRVITSRANRDNMHDLDREKRIRSGNMYGDEAMLDAVQTWRLPDIVFDGYVEIDLGGLTVELHHFGPGNGPGDTIVHVPSARTAWTGNFLCHAGIAHMLLQVGPVPYLASVRAMRDTLPDLETIVPGHGPIGPAPDAFDWLIGYLERLNDEVTDAFERGLSLDETYVAATDPWADGNMDDRLVAAIRTYPGWSEQGQEGFVALTRNLHRLNILTTYRVCEQLAARVAPPLERS